MITDFSVDNVMMTTSESNGSQPTKIRAEAHYLSLDHNPKPLSAPTQKRRKDGKFFTSDGGLSFGRMDGSEIWTAS